MNSRDPIRDVKALEMFNQDMTYSQIGAHFGFSRQRAEQLIIRILGYKPQRREKQRKQAAERREAFLDSFAFRCKVCKKAVTHREGNNRHIYCSETCRNLNNNHRRKGRSVCSYCNKEFSPWYTRQYADVRNDYMFCCSDHYWKFRREHSIIYYRSYKIHMQMLTMKNSGMRSKQIAKELGKTNKQVEGGLHKIRTFLKENNLTI